MGRNAKTASSPANIRPDKADEQFLADAWLRLSICFDNDEEQFIADIMAHLSSLDPSREWTSSDAIKFALKHASTTLKCQPTHAVATPKKSNDVISITTGQPKTETLAEKFTRIRALLKAAK